MTLDFQNSCFNFIITLMDFLLIPNSSTESAVILIKVLGVACWEKRCSAKANIFSHLESQSNFDFFIFMSAKLIINMINIKTSQNFKNLRIARSYQNFLYSCCILLWDFTHYSPVLLFYTPWKPQKYPTFLSGQYCSDLKKVLSMEILVFMIISKLVGKPSCFERTEGRLVVLKFPFYTDFGPVW